MTALQILGDLRCYLEAENQDSLVEMVDALERELGLEYLPQKTFAAAEEIFGGSIYNPTSRTFQSLSRRVQHALRVWAEKYGPLTQEQAEYADDVLAAALRKAARDAGGDRSKLFRFAQATIARSVNHEVVDQGFKRRAGLVDVGDVLVFDPDEGFRAACAT